MIVTNKGPEKGGVIPGFAGGASIVAAVSFEEADPAELALGKASMVAKVELRSVGRAATRDSRVTDASRLAD